MNRFYPILKKSVFPLLTVAIICLPVFYHVYATSIEDQRQVQSAYDVQKTQYVTVTVYQGTVSIKPPGESSFQTVRNAVRIQEGTFISTGPSSRAQIMYPSGTTTRLDSNTTIQLKTFSPEPQRIIVSILEGRIWSRVKKLLGTESYETESKGVTATVRGTAYEHAAKNGITLTRVVEGTIVITCKDQPDSTAIQASLKGETDCSQETPTSVVPLSQEDATDEWISFNTAIDKLPVVIPTSTVVPSPVPATIQTTVPSTAPLTVPSSRSDTSISGSSQSTQNPAAPTQPPAGIQVETGKDSGVQVDVQVGKDDDKNDPEVSVGVGGTDVNVNLPGNLPVDIDIGLGKKKDKDNNGNANGRDGGNGNCNGVGNPNCMGKD